MPKPNLCRWHLNGVPIGAAPFYVKGCPRCETKRAAGVVTTDTPPPPDRHLEHGRKVGNASMAAARARKAPRPAWRTD